MRKILSSSLVVAGMLSTPIAVTNAETPDAASEYRNDPRLESLNKFFQNGDCPAQVFSADFLHVADQHNLDWRLLPSISMVESGGGREARNNNMFGWDGGRAIYISIRAGIHDVAARLGNSKLYRDKVVDEILRIYNPDTHYPGVVKSVMRRISPSE
jgi:hypothetical protein